MTKTYYFDYDNGNGSATLQVDLNIFTPDTANMVLQYRDWEYDEDADPIKESLKKIALACIYQCNDRSTEEVIEDFGHIDGYPLIDGSEGITLISVTEHVPREYHIEMMEA